MKPLKSIIVLAIGFALLAPALRAQSPEELLKSGHADEAIKLLKTRIAASPRDAVAYNLLSRAYLSLQSWDGAVIAGEKAAALDSGNSRYHLWLGRAYGAKAEHSIFFKAIPLAHKTRNEFQKAVQLQSNDLDAQSDLAEFFIEAPGFLGGGVDKAEAQAAQIAAMDKATAHWVKARIAEKDGNNDAAEKEYRAAISAAQQKAPYWLNLASFDRRMKRYDEMEQAINHAVAAEHTHDDIFYEAASMLFRTGRNFPGAVAMLQRYLNSPEPVEAAPTFEAHYMLGSILEKMGDSQAAVVEYRAALSLAKDYSPAQDALKRLSQ